MSLQKQFVVRERLLLPKFSKLKFTKFAPFVDRRVYGADEIPIYQFSKHSVLIGYT